MEIANQLIVTLQEKMSAVGYRRDNKTVSESSKKHNTDFANTAKLQQTAAWHHQKHRKYTRIRKKRKERVNK